MFQIISIEFEIYRWDRSFHVIEIFHKANQYNFFRLASHVFKELFLVSVKYMREISASLFNAYFKLLISN